MQVITQDIEELAKKEINTNEEWYEEYHDTETGTKIYSKTLFPDCDMKTYKAVCVMNRKIEICIKAMKDHGSRATYNSKFKVSKILEQK
jgi:hypothetical protein